MKEPYYNIDEAAKFSILDVEKKLFKKPNNAPYLQKYSSRADHWVPPEKVKEIALAKQKKTVKE